MCVRFALESVNRNLVNRVWFGTIFVKRLVLGWLRVFWWRKIRFACCSNGIFKHSSAIEVRCYGFSVQRTLSALDISQRTNAENGPSTTAPTAPTDMQCLRSLFKNNKTNKYLRQSSKPRFLTQCVTLCALYATEHWTLNAGMHSLRCFSLWNCCAYKQSFFFNVSSWK